MPEQLVSLQSPQEMLGGKLAIYVVFISAQTYKYYKD